MKNAITLNNISFGYDEKLLDNINLNIHKGDFIGITGENGSGKTTLLKIILGQLKPNSGSIEIEDREKNKKSIYDIGYVRQMNMETVVSFPITAVEVVSLSLYEEMGIIKIPTKKIKTDAINALSIVNLKDKAYYNYNNMSGGEQQRVLIAKALVNNPNILIFDEPTAGIDNQSKNSLFELLKHLNSKHNITIIVVTHELDFCKNYFNRILLLKDKKLQDIREAKIC